MTEQQMNEILNAAAKGINEWLGTARGARLSAICTINAAGIDLKSSKTKDYICSLDFINHEDVEG